MECKNCSAVLPEESVFCSVCGTRVDGKKTCPKCQKLIEENSIFCRFCGERQNKEAVVDTVLEFESVENEKESDCVIGEQAKVDSCVISAIAEDIVSEDEKKEEASQNEEVIAQSEKEETPVTEPILCTQCGSNDIELISEELGVCRMCGTQVVINTPQETNIVNNNINIQMVESTGQAPITFYELPIEMSKESFFAEALTKVALDKNSPDDIFTSGKFEPVRTIYCQYLIGAGNVDMTYSATIGYDRKEEYYDTVKKYDSSIQGYRYEKVKKTRTVTDWSPFSGTYKDNLVGTANNEAHKDANVYDYFSHCSGKAREYNAKDSKAPAPLPPTEEGIREVESSIRITASSNCKSSLPGDHHKDFNSSCTVDLTELESHVAPRYIIDYKYYGLPYNLCAHAVKESVIEVKAPSAKKEIDKEIENQQTVKQVNIATFVSLLFAILSAILFPIALKIIFTIIAIALFIANCAVKSKFSKEIYSQKLLKKKEDLISLLRKKGITIPNKLKEGVQL